MSESKPNPCAFILIKAWTPLNKPQLKAFVKSTTVVKIPDMPKGCFISSISRIKSSRYLMSFTRNNNKLSSIHESNIKLSTRTKVIDMINVARILTKQDVTLIFRYDANAVVIKDGKKLAHVDITAMNMTCKNGFNLGGKWIHELGDDIYVIDNRNRLVAIGWSDIAKGIYKKKSIIDIEVADFSVTKRGIGILHTDGTLQLPGKVTTNLAALSDKAVWTIVVKAAKHWIVSGDLDGQAIIASVNSRGHFGKPLTISMTSNGYLSHASMFCIKPIFERDDRSVILAVERDGFCHLTSVGNRGKMKVIKSIPSFYEHQIEYPYENYKTILAVTRADNEGNYMLSGYENVKIVNMRLK